MFACVFECVWCYTLRRLFAGLPRSRCVKLNPKNVGGKPSQPFKDRGHPDSASLKTSQQMNLLELSFVSIFLGGVGSLELGLDGWTVPNMAARRRSRQVL